MRRFFGKRALAVAALLLAVLLVCACAGGDDGSTLQDMAGPDAASEMESPSAGAQIALISTEARLDSAFGQSVWNAAAKFAGENGYTSGSYKTEEGDAEAAASTLELALRGGAEVVLAMDETVTAAVAEAALRSPEVEFILLDAPVGYVPRINAVQVGFSAVQGGWMAGYVAAYEAQDTLGLIAAEGERGDAYALGFTLGLEYAAREQNLPPQSLRLVWQHADEWQEKDAAAFADELFESGAGLVFSALPAAQQAPVVEAADMSGARLFGVGLDLISQPKAVLASVDFEPRTLVYSLLEQWHAGSFPAGQVAEGSVADGDVLLAVEPMRFTHAREWILSQAPLRFEGGTLAAELQAALTAGEDGATPTPAELELEYVMVTPPGPPPSEDEGWQQPGAAQEDGSLPQDEGEFLPQEDGTSEVPVV